MANGNLQTLEPPDAPLQPETRNKPGIEIEIGAAVAACATALAAGLLEYRAGRVDPEIKNAGAMRMMTLAKLQMLHDSEMDFDAIARQEGLRALLPLLDNPDLRELRAFPAGEATVTILLDELIKTTNKTVRLVRAMDAADKAAEYGVKPAYN